MKKQVIYYNEKSENYKKAPQLHSTKFYATYEHWIEAQLNELQEVA